MSTQGATRLLTAAEVAGLLQVKKVFVYRLARENKIPVVRLGDRYLRFEPGAISRWIAERQEVAR